MTTGPFLYDDEPAPLHTGTPRRRNGLIVAVLLGTVLVAVGFVAAMFVVRGTPGEQSEEVVGVFLAALENGDDETANGLLCTEVVAGLEPGDVPDEYRLPLPAEVVGSEETEVDGEPAYAVEVRWADGATSSLTVINEDGPHVCGTSSAG
jgi:hypothetical protein